MKPGLIERFFCQRHPGGRVSVKRLQGGFNVSVKHFLCPPCKQSPAVSPKEAVWVCPTDDGACAAGCALIIPEWTDGRLALERSWYFI